MITYIITIVAGLILLFVVVSLFSKIKSIDKNAEMTEGIVYENEFDNNSSFDNINFSSAYPVIRFCTKEEQKWITKKYSFAFPVNTYKQGEKVVVVYDKDNPESFYLKNGKTNFVFIAVLIVALSAILSGIYQLLKTHLTK